MEFLYTIISIFEYLGDRMKERLDIILVQDGYFDTREKAKRAIMAGIVLVDDKKIDQINLDSTKISWSRALKNDLKKNKKLDANSGQFNICIATTKMMHQIAT